MVCSIIESWLFNTKETKAHDNEYKVLVFGDWHELMSENKQKWLNQVGMQKVSIGITRPASGKELDYWVTNLEVRRKEIVAPKLSHSDHLICKVVVNVAMEGIMPGNVRLI